MSANDIKPEKGKLLISAPQLTDFFKRSVIYLVEHNENGTVGFVINKPLKFKVSEVIENFPEFRSKVYLGGPVQTDLINFLHRAGDVIEGSYYIADGIYWGGNYESLKALINTSDVNPDDFLFFLGYAGWSPNQLNDEIINNSWFVHDGTIDIVFNEKRDSLWNKVLKQMGGEFSVIASFPEDPSVN